MPRIDSEFVYHPTPEAAGVAPLPYQKFLAGIFGAPALQYKVSTERQTELTSAIHETLENLSERERRILELRFGLSDGVTRTLTEVGSEFGLTRERIRQIEAKALRRLRHPSCSRALKEAMPLPAGCFAKDVFKEAELVKDVPQTLAIPLSDIDWSSETRSQITQLAGYGSDLYTLRHIIAGQRVFEFSKLTPEASVEITVVTKKIIDEGAETVLRKLGVTPETVEEAAGDLVSPPPLEEDEEEDFVPDYFARGFEDDDEEEDFELPPLRGRTLRARLDREDETEDRLTNNLLPDVEISEEKLVELSQIPLKELGIRKSNFWTARHYGDETKIHISRVGELLNLPQQDFGRLIEVGSQTAYAMGQGLQRILDLPKDRFPADFLARKLQDLWISQRYGMEPSRMSEILSGRTESLRLQRERVQMAQLRSLMKGAIEAGAVDSVGIQKYIEEKMPKLLGKNSNEWMIRAAIEYLFNHPSEE